MAFYNCCMTLGEAVFPINFAVVFIYVKPPIPINSRFAFVVVAAAVVVVVPVPVDSLVLMFFDSLRWIWILYISQFIFSPANV